MKSFASDRGLEDAGCRWSLVPEEGNDGKVPVSLELVVVCDPNDRNEGHPMTVAGVTVRVHLVSSIAMALEREHWHLVPSESR